VSAGGIDYGALLGSENGIPGAETVGIGILRKLELLPNRANYYCQVLFRFAPRFRMEQKHIWRGLVLPPPGREELR
jgi:hypothetical protein